MIVKSNNYTFSNIFIVMFVKASYFHVKRWVTDLKMEMKIFWMNLSDSMRQEALLIPSSQNVEG